MAILFFLVENITNDKLHTSLEREMKRNRVTEEHIATY
jgi:hypothetical protein